MRWVASVLVVVLWLKVYSQSPVQFNHYTVEQGLPDNNIGDILQDERGFTWLATANGLSRFDGVQFRNFFRGGSFTKIPGNTVYRVKKWKDNFLVIATDNGLGIINTSNGEYEHLLIPSEKEISSHANNFQSLDITIKNDIIAGSFTGVYVFNSELQLVTKKEAGYKPADIGKKRIYYSLDIYTLQSGDAMVTTIDGLLLYDHRQKLIYSINKQNNPAYRQFGSLKMIRLLFGLVRPMRYRSWLTHCITTV